MLYFQWTLRGLAGCRRYQSIVAVQPGNVEALRYLVALCQELGRPADVEKYSELLRRAERAEVGNFAVLYGCALADRD